MALRISAWNLASKLVYAPFNCYKAASRTANITSVRYLYGPQHLGLDKYIEQRERCKYQYGDTKDHFFSRIRQYFNSDASSQGVMVFTEDLKNVVNLCETDEDLELCVKMLKRFNHQNKELRFGTFVFGPVVSRLLYYLDKPDLMLSVLNDEELNGFFDQFTSYQIAMDLLYKKKRYDDVLSLYDQMRTKQLYGTKFPRDCVVIALAACYHQATTESYKFALQLVRDARESGALLLRKGLTFAAALALKMNDPKIAMELLALTAQMNYISVRNLRIIALSELGRFEDVFLIMRQIIHQDIPSRFKTDSEVCSETLERVERCLDVQGDEQKKHMFEQVKRALVEGGHISKHSLDELLNRPMQIKIYHPQRDVVASASSSSRHGLRNPSRQRAGLRDEDDV